MGNNRPYLARMISYPASYSEIKMQRAVWAQDIIGLMVVVILIAAVAIAAGTLAGLMDFTETIPIYVLLFLILPTWWGAKHGGWKWACYIPTLLTFSLGVYGSLNNGFSSISVTFYVMSIFLAGMLISDLAGFLMVPVCSAAYAGLGYLSTGILLEALGPILTFTFGLTGLSLLRWYSSFRLQEAFEAQIESNALLKTEITRREQAELTQREQEAQLRRLADNTTDVVTEMDKTGIIRYASPSYQATLGYDPETLLGSNSFDLIHPEDVQGAKIVASEAGASRKPRSIQARARHQDGHDIWMEISGTPIYDTRGDLTGFVLSSRDVSLQKQAEDTLQRSERKFRRIIEFLPLGIHMYTLQEDGQLIFSGYNPAADTILGIDHARFIDSTIESVFPGLVKNGAAKRFCEIARSGGQWTEEYFGYSDSPVQRIFEVRAFQTEPGKMVSAFSEITQRIQAMEALHLSEEKFSTAFRTSPDSININRLSDGVYLDINQGFTRLTGYSREEVLGKLSLELNIWADPQDRARLVEGLLKNGVVENMEARFQKKNGMIGMGLMSARIIMIQGEKCILSITHEITEWIQAQLDLRKAHAQLEQAYEATLQGWAHALELREHETADHSRRVVDQTLCIAQALGISGDELVHLRRGALLHDIGKLGIPDEILLKPGRLTPDEWEIMRLHPEYARAMLSNIEYLHPSITIPYSHHEKWDGTGYPQGLKGKAIPLPARIFAIVDVFDALTHDRPYRLAWSEAEVQNYMIAQKEKQFDPEIVDLFLTIYQ